VAADGCHFLLEFARRVNTILRVVANHNVDWNLGKLLPAFGGNAVKPIFDSAVY
jgi:hypothetical protein